GPRRAGPARRRRLFARLRSWLRDSWLGRLPLLMRDLVGTPAWTADEKKSIRKNAPPLHLLLLEKRETTDPVTGVGAYPFLGAGLTALALNPGALRVLGGDDHP